MKFRNLCIIIILSLLNVPGLAVGEPLSLSLEEVIARALEQNRELQIATLEVERAKARARWSGRLEDPELEVSGSSDFAGRDEGEAELEMAFVQRFPLTSRLKDEKTVRRTEVVLAATEIAENRRLLAHDVHVLAVDLLAGRITRAAQQRLVGLNEEIIASLQGRAEVGEASQLDVMQMRLNGRTLVREISSLDARMMGLQSALREKLNLEPGQAVMLEGGMELPVALPGEGSELEAVLQSRPDYLAILVKTDVARAELVLQRAKRWRDVGVGLMVQGEESVDEPRGLERNTFLGLGFSIPLPLRQRNQEGIALAAIDINSAQRQVEAKKFAIKNELASALQVRALAWKNASETIGKDVRLANENFLAFKKAYENGQVGIIQVQRAHEQLIELETTAVELQREYHIADARVRFVRGDYPDLGIPQANSPKH